MRLTVPEYVASKRARLGKSRSLSVKHGLGGWKKPGSDRYYMNCTKMTRELARSLDSQKLQRLRVYRYPSTRYVDRSTGAFGQPRPNPTSHTRSILLKLLTPSREMREVKLRHALAALSEVDGTCAGDRKRDGTLTHSHRLASNMIGANSIFNVSTMGKSKLKAASQTAVLGQWLELHLCKTTGSESTPTNINNSLDQEHTASLDNGLPLRPYLSEFTSMLDR